MNNSNYTFSFKFETHEKFFKLIQNLKCNKATQQYDIPIKISKENSEIFPYVCHNFNNYLFSKIFPFVVTVVVCLLLLLLLLLF